MVREIGGIFFHTAWSTDGEDISVVEVDEAIEIGAYQDSSAVESFDRSKYTWMPFETEEEDEDEPIEDDDDNLESDVDEAIEDLKAQIETLQGKVESNLAYTVEGVGNLNELIGTNLESGWTSDGSVEYIDASPYDDSSTVKAAVISGTYGLFQCDSLRAKLAQDVGSEGSATYTLSFDYIAGADITASICDEDGTNPMIEFGTFPAADEWTHAESTADAIDTDESGQAFMITGPLTITNLKIEAGAIATPWRASIDEVDAKATRALTEVEKVTQHFWHDEEGAHVEADNSEYRTDMKNDGLYINYTNKYSGDSKDIASFTKDGIHGETIDGQQLYHYGYGLLEDSSGVQRYGIWGTFGKRDDSDGVAVGNYSYSAGLENRASGACSMALGDGVWAIGDSSHAEGVISVANGEGSHAEGRATSANGKYSHAEGVGTIANEEAQHASGRYNATDDDALFIVGNGSSESARSNAFKVMSDGGIISSDHGSSIGTVITGTAAATSITNTMQNHYMITLPKGTWLVTGFIGTSVTNSKATSFYYNLRQSAADNSAEMIAYYPASVAARAEIVKIITVTGDAETWYLNSRFSVSGLTGTVMTLAHAGLTAVRII